MPTGPVPAAPPGVVPDVVPLPEFVPLPGARLGGWTDGWAGTAEVFGVGGPDGGGGDGEERGDEDREGDLAGHRS